jgi:hypothetical protein
MNLGEIEAPHPAGQGRSVSAIKSRSHQVVAQKVLWRWCVVPAVRDSFCAEDQHTTSFLLAIPRSDQPFTIGGV